MLLRSPEEEWSVARSTRNTIIGWQCLVQSQASVHQEIHRFAMQKPSRSLTQNSSKTLSDSEWNSMWSNSLGKAFTVTCFGESHGPGVGATIDGCPAGLPLTINDVQQALDLRIPREIEIVSARREPDVVEIFSGVFQNRTTGAPITLNIRNKDTKSADYSRRISC